MWLKRYNFLYPKNYAHLIHELDSTSRNSFKMNQTIANNFQKFIGIHIFIFVKLHERETVSNFQNFKITLSYYLINGIISI